MGPRAGPFWAKDSADHSAGSVAHQRTSAVRSNRLRTISQRGHQFRRLCLGRLDDAQNVLAKAVGHRLGLVRHALHLGGNDRKPPALCPGPRRLDHRIDGEDVGLQHDLVIGPAIAFHAPTDATNHLAEFVLLHPFPLCLSIQQDVTARVPLRWQTAIPVPEAAIRRFFSFRRHLDRTAPFLWPRRQPCAPKWKLYRRTFLL